MISHRAYSLPDRDSNIDESELYDQGIEISHWKIKALHGSMSTKNITRRTEAWVERIAPVFQPNPACYSAEEIKVMEQYNHSQRKYYKAFLGPILTSEYDYIRKCILVAQSKYRQKRARKPRSQSAYAVFCEEKRKTLTQVETKGKLQLMWKELSPQERDRYRLKAKLNPTLSVRAIEELNNGYYSNIMIKKQTTVTTTTTSTTNHSDNDEEEGDDGSGYEDDELTDSDHISKRQKIDPSKYGSDTDSDDQDYEEEGVGLSTLTTVALETAPAASALVVNEE